MGTKRQGLKEGCIILKLVLKISSIERYIFGPKGLRNELDDVGVRYIGSGPEYLSEVRCSEEGQGLIVKLLN